MSVMETTFHTHIATPLYTTAFTPQNAGQYAGALIFLIILGIIFRFLSAAKVQMEHRWREEQAVRKVVISRSSDVDGDGNNKSAGNISPVAVSEKGMGTATTVTAATSAASSSGASTTSETAVNDGVGASGTGLKTTRKERRKAGVAPWRWKVDMIRGFLQLCVALVGYLL